MRGEGREEKGGEGRGEGREEGKEEKGLFLVMWPRRLSALNPPLLECYLMNNSGEIMSDPYFCQ